MVSGTNKNPTGRYCQMRIHAAARKLMSRSICLHEKYMAPASVIQPKARMTVVLVTLTLSLQCAGMAVVIAWARPRFAPEVLRLGAIRSAILVMRLMTAFIGLHLLEIVLWAGFYRWLCFTSWESAFLLLGCQLCDRWLRR